MVGRGDEHAIDVRTGQDLTVVVVGVTTPERAAGALLGIGRMGAPQGLVAPALVHVTDGEDLDASVAQATAKVAHAHHAAADQCDPEAVVCRGAGGLGPRGQGPGCGDGPGGRQGLAKELTATQPWQGPRSVGRRAGTHGASCPANSRLTLSKKALHWAISGMARASCRSTPTRT